MRPDEDPSWRDLLLLIRFLWRQARRTRLYLSALGITTYFVMLAPDEWELARFIALLTIAFLFFFSQNGTYPGD